MHEPFFLRGTLLYSSSPDTIEILDDGWLLCRNGKAAGVFRQKPERFKNLDVLDYSGKLIIPGMTDLHLHAPQFSFRGLGMDLELLDWLNTYTFPEEAKYEDLSYAETAYESFVARLTRSTTTRACIFATLHLPATLLLMQKLEDAGLDTYVGKVNMNRNCPAYLREISTNQAIRDTESWVLQSRERFVRTKPILTPRFIPSCTDDLMYALSRLRAKYDLPVQSHLSENLGEIDWVRELCPRSKFYGDAYDQFGMFGGDYPCIMAHCVHSNEAEQELMLKRGVYIAHSPESNMNLASGVAPVNQFIDRGLHVGLATDVAGGSHESMLKAMMHAIQASKLRWRLLSSSARSDRFWMGTSSTRSYWMMRASSTRSSFLRAQGLNVWSISPTSGTSARSSSPAGKFYNGKSIPGRLSGDFYRFFTSFALEFGRLVTCMVFGCVV